MGIARLFSISLTGFFLLVIFLNPPLLHAEEIPQFNFNLGLFGDVHYASNSREDGRNAFSIHEIDLYITGNLGDRITFLSELALEDGKELDLERFWLGYTFSDLFILRAGKFHTAIGYWNKTYHHGKKLFTTIDRPFFLAFEHDEGVMPTHIVGIEMEGSRTIGFARFKYEFEIGNSPRFDNDHMRLKPNYTLDDNNSKQPVIRLSIRPNTIPDLIFGVFGTTYVLETSGETKVNERIIGMDISYTKLPWEFISEYFRFYNSSDSADAFYIQTAYAFSEYPLTPYIRYEMLDVDEGDPYFTALEGVDRNQFIFGLKYDIDVIYSSIKAQYRYDDKKDDKTYNVLELQWAFNFNL